MKPINTDELKSLKSGDSNCLLINTLDPDNFKQTKIPGAINIPQSEDSFTTQVEQSANDKSQPVVVYCASAECDSSTKAAKKLEDAGFTNVLDYEGGAKAWQESGEKLVLA